MGRIMAIDYGLIRTGIAVSAPLQIIANGLETVPTENLIDFLKAYLSEETVETIVVGEPLHLDGTPAQITPQINGFLASLRRIFPMVDIARQDERFTSVEAKRIILDSGVKKKKRRDKSLVDKVSAVLILQSYMEEKNSSNGNITLEHR